MKVKFYGGAGGNVIPTRINLWNSNSSLLLDCGDIVPGKKETKHKATFAPLLPQTVNKTLLTHGHTDHVGALCDFVEAGFNGQIISTRPTKEITEALLRDNFAKRLVDDVFALYDSPKEFLEPFELSEGVNATFYPAQGHILGASSILLDLKKENLRVLFSGDLGNTNKTMLEINGDVPKADVVIIECTYGRREHHPDFGTSTSELYRGINDAYANNGNFYIPVLSINKLQEALFHLNLAKEEELIPRDANVIVDSTLGEVITKIYSKENNRKYFSAVAKKFFETFSVTYPFQYNADINEEGRNIILASSGLDGLRGRFKKYLSGLSSDANSIAIISHTLEGSLLNDISLGKPTIGTNGQSIDLKAKSFNLSGFSSHADATQLISWLTKTEAKYVFLVHGEDESRMKLKQMIVDRELCCEENIFAPAMLEEFDLTNLKAARNSCAVPASSDVSNQGIGTLQPKTTYTLFGRILEFPNPIE